MPTPSDPISLGIAHQRLLCWGQGGARAAVSLLKLWWVRLGLGTAGTIPPWGLPSPGWKRSLVGNSSPRPGFWCFPGAFLFVYLVLFQIFSQKSHPCSMQSQEHLAWHPLPMARWLGAAGEHCAPRVLVPSLSSKKNTLGEFPLYQTHFHQAHIKGHRFILF